MRVIHTKGLTKSYRRFEKEEGLRGSIRSLFNSLFALAAFVMVPTTIRMERLHVREATMFGDRILADGDMYEQNIKFLDDAARYDTGEPPQVCLKQHEQWATELLCPVLLVDGTKDVSENAAWIAECFIGTQRG